MFLEVGFQYLFRLVFLESKQGLILSFSTSSRVIFTQKDLIFISFWWWVFLKISTYLSHLDHIRPVTSCFFVLFSFFFSFIKKKKNLLFFLFRSFFCFYDRLFLFPGNLKILEFKLENFRIQTSSSSLSSSS